MDDKKAKEQLENLCEEYPREAVMALYDLMGVSELWDGIPTALEDYCFDFDW